MARSHALFVALLASAAAQAEPKAYEGTFSGAAEVAPNASPGTGQGLAVHDATTHVLTVDLAFSGLVGPTTVAHIHCCAGPTTNAPVAVTFTGFPAGVTAGSYQRMFDLSTTSTFNAPFVSNNGGTAASAEAALAAGLAAGMAYLNIHTQTFPGGEIRANLVRVDPIFGNGFE